MYATEIGNLSSNKLYCIIELLPCQYSIRRLNINFFISCLRIVRIVTIVNDMESHTIYIKIICFVCIEWFIDKHNRRNKIRFANTCLPVIFKIAFCILQRSLIVFVMQFRITWCNLIWCQTRCRASKLCKIFCAQCQQKRIFGPSIHHAPPWW